MPVSSLTFTFGVPIVPRRVLTTNTPLAPLIP